MNEVQLQVGVKAVLRNSEGKYLLVKRSVRKYPTSKGKGSWDIVGGRITPGDELMKNLAREIYEETGLALVGEPKLVAAQDILHVPGKHIVRLTYMAEVEGEIKIDKEELDDYKWLSLDEIKKQSDIDIYFEKLLNQGVIE